MIINQIVKGSGGSAPALYRAFELDANDALIPSTTESQMMDFTGMVSIVESYLLYRAYYNNTAISGAVDMSDLTTVSGQSACAYMFYGCTGITSVNLSNLTAVTGTQTCGYMFLGCSGLLGLVDLSSLTTISGTSGCTNMFNGCTSITGVVLSSLTTLTGNQACQNMFSGCTSLTSLSFPAITTTSFGTRINQFSGLCNNIPSITLHFPSNVQSQVEALTGYSATAPFGAVSGTVLFDLPATE